MNKEQLRAQYKALRDSLSEKEKAEASEKIIAQLKPLLFVDSIQHIGCYFALPEEPNLQALYGELLLTKTLYFPRYTPDGYVMKRIANFDSDFEVGKFNITEPLNTLDSAQCDIDAWLVPGLAFDSSGARLGFGKGIYDRLTESTCGLLFGICFANQCAKTGLPCDHWDILMGCVICG